MSGRATVVKVGGSLLTRASLAEELLRWLRERPASETQLLIAGGGSAVDDLREQHSIGALTDAEAHWAAIAVMDQHAEQLAAATALPVLQSLSGPVLTTAWFAPHAFLFEEEPHLPGAPLPIGWHVTSDSIAARVATVLDAKLVLLKSAPAAHGAALQQLADRGYVDAYFPQASVGLREVEFQTLEQ